MRFLLNAEPIFEYIDLVTMADTNVWHAVHVLQYGLNFAL